MKTRKMSTFAALATSAALALSFPAAGAFADTGGVPNSDKPCKAKKKQKKHADKNPTKGKSCGFNFVG
jgi:hypothetical protein